MRLLSIVALALAFVLARGDAVLAGRDWCATDPVLTFANGTRVQWVASFGAAGLPSLTGPVTYWIEVPSNVGAIEVTLPAAAAPERVTVSYTGRQWDGVSAIAVRATITVPASTRFAATASVLGNVEEERTVAGTSNAPMRIASAVSPDGWSAMLPIGGVVATRTVTSTTTVYAP